MNGKAAATFIGPIRPVTVAPAVIIARPSAASGVSCGLILKSDGSISPSPPRTSHTPMKCRNKPGITTGACAFISSTDITNFITPAKIKSSASST